MTGLSDKLNEPGQRLYRTALRDKIRELLNHPLISYREKLRGITKLEQPGASALTLEKRRDKLLDIIRARHLATNHLTRREREALTPDQLEQLAQAA